MPLHRQQPRRTILRLRRLDQFVFSPPSRHQPSPQAVDGLVMERVDGDASAPERLCGAAARLEPHLVRPRLACAPRIVRNRTRTLGRQVLEQGTAEADIDELDAAANAQDRQGPLARRGEEPELEQVPLAARRIQMRRGLGAIQPGVDVLATGQHHAVDPIERALDECGVEQGRQNDGNAASPEHGAHVGPVDPGPLGGIPGAEHATEGNPRSGHGSTESGKNGQRGSSIRAGSSWMPMSGSVLAPRFTVPIDGAPSTGRPSNSMTPRARSVVSSTSTPYPGLMVAGIAPSTPITSSESERPTMAGSAGPATTRVTRCSGSLAGGRLNVWRGTLNCVSSAVGPARAARPQAGLPRPADLPHAATASSTTSRRWMGMAGR